MAKAYIEFRPEETELWLNTARSDYEGRVIISGADADFLHTLLYEETEPSKRLTEAAIELDLFEQDCE